MAASDVLQRTLQALGKQIIAGLGLSITTPGESGPVESSRATLSADCDGIRYFAVDYDAGDDTNPGFSDVSMALAGASPLKTLEELRTRVPMSGLGRSIVIAIAARAGGAPYRNKADTADDDLDLRGSYGYEQILVRATGTVPTAGAVAFANDTADKIACGAQLLPWTNPAGYSVQPFASPIVGTANVLGEVEITTIIPHGLISGDVVFNKDILGTNEGNGYWTVGTVTTPSSFTLLGSIFKNTYISGGLVTTNYAQLSGGGAPGFPAEPALLNHRFRFDVATGTIPLQNICGSISAYGAQTIIFADDFVVPPTLGDVGYIEEPGTALGRNLAPGETLFTKAAVASRGAEFVGLRCTDVGARSIAVIGDLNTTLFSFCKTAGSVDFQNAKINLSPSYIDETGATITLAASLRANGFLNHAGGSHTEQNAAFLSTTSSVILECSLLQIIGGCLFRRAQFVTTNKTGTAIVNILLTQRPPRWIGGGAGPALLLNGPGGLLGAAHFEGAGSSPAIRIQNAIQSGWTLASLTGSKGCTGVGIMLSFETIDSTLFFTSETTIDQAPIASVTGVTGDIALGFAPSDPIITYRDLRVADIIDNNGNHLVNELAARSYPSIFMGPTGAFTLIVPALRYLVCRATPGGLTPAKADTAPNASGVTAVTLSDTILGRRQPAVTTGPVWINFVAPLPTPGNVAYLSPAVDGFATDVTPPVNVTDQKLRLGTVLTSLISPDFGIIGLVDFRPDNVPVLADGTP